MAQGAPGLVLRRKSHSGLQDPALKREQPKLCLWSDFVSDPMGTKMTPWFGWMCYGYCKNQQKFGVEV